MKLKEKLERLRGYDGLALYKWTAGSGRIGGRYIPLSRLRLLALVCDGGQVRFSAMAPVLFMRHGLPHVVFADDSVLEVKTGPRAGVNVTLDMLKPDESAGPPGHFGALDLSTEDPGDRFVTSKVMSLATSVLYPEHSLVVPTFLRMARNIDTLKPVFSKDVLRIIGGESGDTVSMLESKFRAKINRFGTSTPDGFVVNFQWIRAGGMVVASANGITTRSGSVVFQLPLETFSSEMAALGWRSFAASGWTR